MNFVLIIATVWCGSVAFEAIDPGYLTDEELAEFPETCWVQYEHINGIQPRMRTEEEK